MNAFASHASKSSAPAKTVKVYAVWEDINRRTADGIAPCAYAFSCPEAYDEKVFWGRGGEKQSQVMLAHLMVHVVNEIATSPLHDADVRLVVANTGTDLYFKDHVWKWMLQEYEHSKISGQRFKLWKKALAHKVIANVELVKAEPHELVILDALRAVAGQQVQIAHDNKEHLGIGLRYRNDGPTEDE
jgi:hypothetical protein